jgi:hypothetical protein
MDLIVEYDVALGLSAYQAPHLITIQATSIWGVTGGDDYHFAIYGDPNVSGYIVYKAWVDVVRI